MFPDLFDPSESHVIHLMLVEVEMGGNGDFFPLACVIFTDIRAGVVKSCVQGGGGFAYILFLTSLACDEVNDPG